MLICDDCSAALITKSRAVVALNMLCAMQGQELTLPSAFPFGMIIPEFVTTPPPPPPIVSSQSDLLSPALIRVVRKCRLLLAVLLGSRNKTATSGSFRWTHRPACPSPPVVLV